MRSADCIASASLISNELIACRTISEAEVPRFAASRSSRRTVDGGTRNCFLTIFSEVANIYDSGRSFEVYSIHTNIHNIRAAAIAVLEVPSG